MSRMKREHATQARCADNCRLWAERNLDCLRMAEERRPSWGRPLKQGDPSAGEIFDSRNSEALAWKRSCDIAQRLRLKKAVNPVMIGMAIAARRIPSAASSAPGIDD